MAGPCGHYFLNTLLNILKGCGLVTKLALIGLISGVVWGVVAMLILGEERIGRGGVLVSPLIGVAVALAAGRVRPSSGIGRAAVTLASLYAAVAIFGLACGIFDLATGPNSGPGWRRDPAGVVFQGMIGMLWGLTFAGWFILLWPLSFANHLLIWKVAESAPGKEEPMAESAPREHKHEP